MSRSRFGCKGGRHRSVHVAERVAARLREAGFSPSLAIATSHAARDGIERSAGQKDLDGKATTACKVDR